VSGAQNNSRKPSPQSGSAQTRRSFSWPRADSRIGAIVYATLGGFIVWLIIDVLPHIRITYR
jgi:hypothetical protein